MGGGLTYLSGFGLRHPESDGLAISDIVVPEGASWRLRVCSHVGHSKTGSPGEPQWVPLRRMFFGMPYTDLLHRGGGALAAQSLDAERWRHSSAHC